jgi:lipid II:glycine glycyltransferase (peptidoglycan interpeptide bridge formation enzyme)
MADYTPLTPAPAEWDAFVTAHPRAHLLQLSAWGQLKAAFGWEPVRVALAGADGRIVAGAQLLLRRLPLRLGRLAYVPYGPLVNWADGAQVRALVAALDRAARDHRAAFQIGRAHV